MKTTITALCAVQILLATFRPAPARPKTVNTSARVFAKEPCNEAVNFCWFSPHSNGSEEVQAWGNRWVSQDTQRGLEQAIEVRCIKSYKICIVGRTRRRNSKPTRTYVDIYFVTRWDDVQINATEERWVTEPCEENSLMLNRAEQSVLLVSSPGVDAAKKSCTEDLGPPKTLIYRLSQ